MALKKRQRPEIEEIKGDMTPMIDVTFQLLIFFMLTIKFKMLEGKLSAYLPKDVGVNTSQAEPIEKVEIKLKVEKEGSKRDPHDIKKPWSGDGPFRYGEDRVVSYSVGPKTTRELDELGRRLKEAHALNKERPATIDAYPGSVYEDVVKVLDVALKADFSDITFVGARPDPNAGKK